MFFLLDVRALINIKMIYFTKTTICHKYLPYNLKLFSVKVILLLRILILKQVRSQLQNLTLVFREI